MGPVRQCGRRSTRGAHDHNRDQRACHDTDPTATEIAPTSDVPSTFVDAMHQIGIPLDAHTGWVVAQGICVRLGQPQYDQFKLSEGVERLFSSVPDEQAHAFVAMVAESVCHV